MMQEMQRMAAPSRRECGLAPKIFCLFAGFVLVVCLLLGGCGKHRCAICGEETNREFALDGKVFHICEECYQTYIEAENLFDEEL